MYHYILNMVSEDFLKFFPIISTCKLMADPLDIAKLDPKSMVDTIYAGDHRHC